MRFAPLLAAFALAAGTVGFAQAPPANPAPDLKGLAGVWTVERADLHGRPLPTSDPPVRYRFDDTTLTCLTNDELRLVELDATTTPKRITMTGAERKDGKVVPRAGGEVQRGVYELKADVLTLVVTWPPAAGYPPALTPPAGAPAMVLRLARTKN